jgi:hypothetical protein
VQNATYDRAAGLQGQFKAKLEYLHDQTGKASVNEGLFPHSQWEVIRRPSSPSATMQGIEIAILETSQACVAVMISSCCLLNLLASI